MNPATVHGFGSGVVVGFVLFLLVARIMVAIEDHRRRVAKRAMDDLQGIFERAKADVTTIVATASRKMEQTARHRTGGRR